MIIECWSCGKQIDYPEYISNKPLCSDCFERIEKGNAKQENTEEKTLEDYHELTAIPNKDGYDYDSQEED